MEQDTGGDAVMHVEHDSSRSKRYNYTSPHLTAGHHVHQTTNAGKKSKVISRVIRCRSQFQCQSQCRFRFQCQPFLTTAWSTSKSTLAPFISFRSQPRTHPPYFTLSSLPPHFSHPTQRGYIKIIIQSTTRRFCCLLYALGWCVPPVCIYHVC